MRGALLVVGLFGCGRIDFDPIGPGAGCVLLLEMDEPMWTGAPGEVIDSCAHHDGTATGGATTVAGGVRGRAGTFSAATCVQIPDAPALDPTTELTMSAWYFTDDTSGNPEPMISKRTNNGSGAQYALLTVANAPAVDIGDSTQRIFGTTPSTKTWLQYTAVFDGRTGAGQVRIYVDGALDTMANANLAAVPTFPMLANLTVGCQPLGAGFEHLTGRLDDVALWNRALSDEEVAQWYAATAP